MKKERWKSLLLIAPMFLFLLLSFFIPLAYMLFFAVDDREFATIMPRTVGVFEQRNALADHSILPNSDAYRAVGLDLIEARKNRLVGSAARRLGYENSDFRLILQDTARSLPDERDDVDWQTILIEADPAWGETGIWQALSRASGPLTFLYLRTALGLHEGENADFYLNISLRTLVIALSTTLLCILLGAPAAYLLANVKPFTATILMLALLLPLWTSIIVRSTAWLVILQKNGLLNQLLMALHITNAPLNLVYNRTAVLISLTHVLLPYAVLPLYASMKMLPQTQMQAAYALGAKPLSAFFRIYLPQIMPGISAGGLMVFIIALGYYITPLLLGGAGDQMLPYYIAYNTLQTLNWGLAAALAAMMLVATIVLYIIYVRLVGVERVGV